MDKSKLKLLKKYQEDNTTNKKNLRKYKSSNANVTMQDNQQQFVEASSDSSHSSGSESHQKKRIRSDQQSQEEEEKHKKSKTKKQKKGKSKRFNKQIRKALGLKKQQDINEFLDEIKVQGIQIEELDQYLKRNKNAELQLEKQSKKEKKSKKKIQKESKNHIKLKNRYEDSSSSDLQIPQQARTIYRNKDGTIKEHSDKKTLQIHQQKVMNKLAQWQQGAKEQSEEDNDWDIAMAKNQVWDDPLRRWQNPTVQKPFECRFEGYANRFNIKPGQKWDGVIRGNGFETKYLQQKNIKKMKQKQQQRDYLKNL